MMASAVIYSENILRSIITWAGTQKGVPTPYPHERIQSHRDSPALLFTTHPWRVSSCCLCEQRGSFINRGVEGWAGGSLTSCPGPPFAPPLRAPRSVLDQKKTLSHDCSPRTHIAMGTAVERQLTWATIDYLQAMQCDGKRKEKTFARLTQTGESFSLRLPSHWICGFRELS